VRRVSSGWRLVGEAACAGVASGGQAISSVSPARLRRAPPATYGNGLPTTPDTVQASLARMPSRVAEPSAASERLRVSTLVKHKQGLNAVIQFQPAQARRCSKQASTPFNERARWGCESRR
jgi:hypothetical protein